MSANYKAARNLRAIAGLFAVGCVLNVISWWFGISPTDRQYSSFTYLGLIVVNVVFSAACLLLAPAVRAGRSGAYAIALLIGLLAVITVPIGLLNLFGAAMLFFIGRAWLERRRMSEDPAPDLESGAGEGIGDFSADGRFTPAVAVGIAVTSFVVGAGSAAVALLETEGRNAARPVPMGPTVSSADVVAARFYAMAAETQQELQQLSTLNSGNIDGARQLIETALIAHRQQLGRYEDAVAPAHRAQFVTDMIEQASQYRAASSTQLPRASP